MLLQAHVVRCHVSCQTPPELFPEVQDAHLCSCHGPSANAAALLDSHFPATRGPAWEDLGLEHVNHHFQPWLRKAHQLQAQYPDPYECFPQQAFTFWPYPGWMPRDGSAG